MQTAVEFFLKNFQKRLDKSDLKCYNKRVRKGGRTQ
jgi:hypothetical protein